MITPGMVEAGAKVTAGMLQSAVGVGQAIVGGLQARKKKKQVEKDLNAVEEYQVPTETKQMYESAKMDATTGLSGASKLLATEGAARAGKAAMGASTDRKGGLGMIGAIQKAGQQAGLALAGQEESALMGKKAALRGATTALVGEKGKAFASRQEKQKTRLSISMADMAANKASISQGIGAIGKGAANDALAGRKGLFGLGQA
jgi:hypothetical protein